MGNHNFKRIRVTSEMAKRLLNSGQDQVRRPLDAQLVRRLAHEMRKGR